MKKPFFSILALASLSVAGCTGDDSATRATSPWAQPGSTSQPNPIVQGITVEDEEAKPDPVKDKHYLSYAWRRTERLDPKTGDAGVKYVAPDDPRSVRITAIRDDQALFSFICADVAPFVPGQQVNINDGKNAAYLRVVEKDAKDGLVVAELLPNQVEIPKFELGVEFRYATTEQEIAANTAAQPAAPTAVPAAPATSVE